MVERTTIRPSQVPLDERHAEEDTALGWTYGLREPHCLRLARSAARAGLLLAGLGLDRVGIASVRHCHVRLALATLRLRFKVSVERYAALRGVEILDLFESIRRKVRV